MKKILLIALLAVVSCSKEAASPYFVEKVPPTVSTTYAQSLADLSAGITNEGWYNHEINGKKLVGSTYLITPTGITHMRDKYDALLKEYEVTTKKDDSYLEFTDLTKLCASMKANKSWIFKYAEPNTTVVVSVSMNTNSSNGTIYVYLR